MRLDTKTMSTQQIDDMYRDRFGLTKKNSISICYARSGCAEYLYPLDEIEAHIERNWEALRRPGEKSLSSYWAKLFIRGEFKPVMV